MQRTFIYFAAFTAMGTVFVATMLVAALVLGATNNGSQAASESAVPSASATAEAQAREITITAFDLGFEPAMVDVPSRAPTPSPS